MTDATLGQQYLKELESEAAATRKCLERIPAGLFSWKPHEKSMSMGNLSMIVADIPNWIATAAEEQEIDFATYERVDLKTAADLVKHFDEKLRAAREALEGISDEELDEEFSLKNKGEVLATSSKKDSISSSINHLAHHRGQLTVYMRMNNIPVPSIYGPSADEGGF